MQIQPENPAKRRKPRLVSWQRAILRKMMTPGVTPSQAAMELLNHYSVDPLELKIFLAALSAKVRLQEGK